MQCGKGKGKQESSLFELVELLLSLAIRPIQMRKVSYVAYIDESGDDGVANVRPIDPNGATEWFVLSALVVRAEAQRETIWVRDILKQIRLEQRRTLHFQPLDDWRRNLVCAGISELPVRCFAVISNKANMRRYQN